MAKRGNPNFKKGGPSGNPNGRPKGYAAFAERCREWADRFGLPFLIEIAEDKKADNKTRVDVSRYIVDRGYGKATEHHEINGGITMKNLLTDEGIPDEH